MVVRKIYEIQTPEEAELCLELGVDHVGSVLLPEAAERQPASGTSSPDGRGRGQELLDSAVSGPENRLFRAMDYYRPDLVQFCESLTDEQGKPVDLTPIIEKQLGFKRKFTEISIIRTIPVPAKGNSPGFPTLELAAALEGTSDFFLTDTWLGREPVKGTWDYRKTRRSEYRSKSGQSKPDPGHSGRGIVSNKCL